MYRYAGNDPINQVDPDGADWTYHDLLDAIGYFPSLGEVADAANAIGYALEGDWANAAISAAGMLPGGDALKAGRLAKKVVQEVVEEGAEQLAKREAKNTLQEQRKKQISQSRPPKKKVCGQPPRKPTRYTPHARDRMRQRGISEEQVEETMRRDKSPRKQKNVRYKYRRGSVEVIVDPDGTVVTVIAK